MLLRRTTGVVIPFGSTLSFVGQLIDGLGLKVMTVRMPNAARERYHGILLSFDEKDVPVTSLFVMVRTAHADPHAAGIGVFPEQNIQAEIADFKADLYNKIPVFSDRKIFNNGEAIIQNQIIELVERRLREAGDNIVDESGRTISPADIFSNTFSAALKMAPE